MFKVKYPCSNQKREFIYYIYKSQCIVHLCSSSPLSLAPSRLSSSFLPLHHCPFPWEHLKMLHKVQISPIQS